MYRLILLLIFYTSNTFAQVTAERFHILEQKDSLYYLLTDNALFKFYSYEASGEFQLIKFIESNHTSGARMMSNDNYLFIYYSDSIFYYRNNNPYDITFENVFVTNYPITSMHGFGPYFSIRSGDDYNLMKVENGLITTVEDSLFTHPSQKLVFFTYPYVVIDDYVYKYVEGFDFYEVAEISLQNFFTDIIGNLIVSYFYLPEYWPYWEEKTELNKILIQEPDFPETTFLNWGIYEPQLHLTYGHLRASKNLYHFIFPYTYPQLAVTTDAEIVYEATEDDRMKISDYYIFLLGGDTLKFSKWYDASTFYNLTWTDLTSVQEGIQTEGSFFLSQNYPNPFNPSTTISWQSPEGSWQTIKVFDVLGREVATLVDEYIEAGYHEVELNSSGIRDLASGIYFYQLRAGSYIETKKMILLR